jgi:hypothetical protein
MACSCGDIIESEVASGNITETLVRPGIKSATSRSKSAAPGSSALRQPALNCGADMMMMDPSASFASMRLPADSVMAAWRICSSANGTTSSADEPAMEQVAESLLRRKTPAAMQPNAPGRSRARRRARRRRRAPAPVTQVRRQGGRPYKGAPPQPRRRRRVTAQTSPSIANWIKIRQGPPSQVTTGPARFAGHVAPWPCPRAHPGREAFGGRRSCSAGEEVGDIASRNRTEGRTAKFAAST